MVKTQFSTTWKASKQPRKQRKYRYNAPLHVQRKFMAATLDKPLRVKYGMRNIEVRKGDEILIMRGKFSKKKGKVTVVDVGQTRVSVDGINRTKKDGTKVSVWFNPSNVKIMVLDLEDARRMKKKPSETSGKGDGVDKKASEVGKEKEGKVEEKKELKSKSEEKKE